jgi:DNA-directed RNA polymerase
MKNNYIDTSILKEYIEYINTILDHKDSYKMVRLLIKKVYESHKEDLYKCQSIVEEIIFYYNSQIVLRSDSKTTAYKMYNHKDKLKWCEKSMEIEIMKKQYKLNIIKNFIKYLKLDSEDIKARNNRLKILMVAYLGILSRLQKAKEEDNYSIRYTNGVINIVYYITNYLAKDFGFNNGNDFRNELNLNTTRSIIELGSWIFKFMNSGNDPLLLIDHTGKVINKRDITVIYLNKDSIEQYKTKLIPHYGIPMIAPPIEWKEGNSSDSYGGIVSNESRKIAITPKIKGHRHTMENKSSIYKAVNAMAKVKYEINKDVFNYLKENSEFIKKAYKIDYSKSQMIHDYYTLAISESFLDIPFYLSLQTDWRGRIYTQSFYVNYQGSDLSRALIQFYDGEKLDEIGLNYLFIYAANNHNENSISKLDYNSRIQWVKNNLKYICSLNKEFILQAENPFVFLACCLAIKQYFENKDSIIKLPILLDATCSGVQHFAGLLLDYDIAKEVNLTDPMENKNLAPTDYYSKLLIDINEKINQCGLNDPKFANLSTLKLTRKMVKKSIMTKNYNVRAITMGEQVRSSMDKINHYNTENSEKIDKTTYLAPTIDGNFIELSYNDTVKIGMIINDQIFIRYPNLKVLYDYLLAMVRVFNKVNIPISWTVPHGLNITQSYSKFRDVSVKLNIAGGRQKKVVYLEPLNEMDNLKQSNAFLPNVIHSLDAAHLVNIVNVFTSPEILGPILSIHDCFGSLPNHMFKLSRIIIEEFVKIYGNNDYLNSFHKEMRENLEKARCKFISGKNGKLYVLIPQNDSDDYDSRKIIFPEKPKKGDLKPEHMLKSIYFVN